MVVQSCSTRRAKCSISTKAARPDMVDTNTNEDQAYITARAALRELQKAMEGAAEEVGWKSDDDVVEYIMAMRRNEHNTKGATLS